MELYGEQHAERMFSGSNPDTGTLKIFVMDRKNAPYSIPSMILGILSLVGGGIILAIIGLVLSNRGFDEIEGKEDEYENVGMLKAGKICSEICIWGTCIFIVIFFIICLFFA